MAIEDSGNIEVVALGIGSNKMSTGDCTFVLLQGRPFLLQRHCYATTLSTGRERRRNGKTDMPNL